LRRIGVSPNWRLGEMLRQTTLFMVEKISAVTLPVANEKKASGSSPEAFPA